MAGWPIRRQPPARPRNNVSERSYFPQENHAPVTVVKSEGLCIQVLDLIICNKGFKVKALTAASFILKRRQLNRFGNGSVRYNVPAVRPALKTQKK